MLHLFAWDAFKADSGIVSCNRVAACDATFHQVCLTNQKYDINSHDGCFRCKAPSLFATNHKSIVGAQCNPSKKSELDSSKDRIKLLDEGADDDDDDDDVIILD